METQSPPQKGGGAPKFSANVYCGQTAGWIKMPLETKVGLRPGDSVLDGDPAPPQLSANFYCGHTAGFIKMPLDMEVGLSPGDFLLDEDAAHPLLKKAAEPGGVSPQFSAHVAKRLDGSRWHLAWR